MARRPWLEIVALVVGVAIAHDLTVALDRLLRDRSPDYASLGVASIVAIWAVVLAVIAVVWPRPAIWPPKSTRTLRNALVVLGVMVAVDWLFGFPVVRVVTGELAVHAPDSWLAFIAIALAGPLVEEWLFRGLLWDAIASRARGHAVTFAPMLITSLLFGLWHCRWMLVPAWLTPSGTPVAVHVAFGMCVAVLRWRFRSLGPGLLVHGVWNALYPLTS